MSPYELKAPDARESSAHGGRSNPGDHRDDDARRFALVEVLPMKNAPHWKHKDEYLLGDVAVGVAIMIAIAVVAFGLTHGWF